MKLADYEEWTRLTGVVISLIGAYIASPEAPKQLLQEFWGWALGRIKRLRGWLSRQLWPHLPPSLQRLFAWLAPEIRLTTGTAEVRAGAGIATLSFRTTWKAERGIPERLDALEGAINSLEDRIGDLSVTIEANKSAINERVQEIEAAIAHTEGNLRTQIATITAQALTTDARAFPVIGLGIVLTGLADALASWWTPLWWTVMSLSVTMTMAVTGITWRDRRRLAS